MEAHCHRQSTPLPTHIPAVCLLLLSRVHIWPTLYYSHRHGKGIGRPIVMPQVSHAHRQR